MVIENDTSVQSIDPVSNLRAIIVLAAGAGTRMRSTLPKVLHPIAGKPLLWHALCAAAELRPDSLVAVIGHGRDQVGAYLAEHHPLVRQAIQHEQLGTGHAVACGLSEAAGLTATAAGAGTSGVTGTVLVTYGDVPLLTAQTLRALAAAHEQAGNAVTVLTAVVPDPTGYGRIIRDSAGELAAIVEHKDATADQRDIPEINSGVYAFDGTILVDALARLTSTNSQGERYLTDVVATARGDGHRVGTLMTPDPAEIEGVNDRVQLADLSRRLNARLIRRAQLAGVTVTDPATTWIHSDVTIGADTQLLPGTSLEGGTIVGSNCVIGPDTTLSACQVADGAVIIRSHCLDSSIGRSAHVGPYAYLRAGVVLADKAKVGTFVEVKKSTIGPGTKVPHLSYIGDATIGAASNIGAGTITANYDGVGKYPTSIGANVFVGSNSTLIAPSVVDDGAYVAAGSTLTDDVAPGDLAVARGRQRAVKGWVLRRRAGTASDKAARAAGAQPDAADSGHGASAQATGAAASGEDRPA